MNKEDIEYKVKKIIVESIAGDVESDNIKNNISLRTIGINSISLVKIIVRFEKEFNIEFEDNDLLIGKFNTVQNFVDYVQKKLEC